MCVCVCWVGDLNAALVPEGVLHVRHCSLFELQFPKRTPDAVLEADVVRMGDGGVDFPTAWVVHVGGRAAAWD